MLQVLLLIGPELQYEDHSHVETSTNRIGSWQSIHAGLNLWSLRRCHRSWNVVHHVQYLCSLCVRDSVGWSSTDSGRWTKPARPGRWMERRSSL